jgi:GntR family transcriptional regulator
MLGTNKSDIRTLCQEPLHLLRSLGRYEASDRLDQRYDKEDWPVAKPAAYQQIAHDLRERIRRGEFLPGTQIPTEAELQAQYGFSRNTVRNAVNELISSGLLDTISTRGSFVRERRRPLTITATRYERSRGTSANDAYKDELDAQGREHLAEFSMQMIPATPEIATRLKVRVDSFVVQRKEILYIDGHANAIQESYYPLDIAADTDLAKNEDIPRGTIRVLKELGHEEVGHRDEVSPRMPTEDEDRVLQLGTAVPVLEWIRTAYSNERPVRLTWRVYAGNGIVLVYELGNVDAFTGPS